MPTPEKTSGPQRMDVTREDLERIEETQERRKDQPKRLPLADIKTADRVFQWRRAHGHIEPDPWHVDELAKTLKNQGTPLDPILVTAVGDTVYVVDGHHRLHAYYKVGWKRPVPVEWFEGDVKAARKRALDRNSKNQLVMTKEEKLEAAWILVQEGELTKRELKETGLASPSTFATMRRKLAKLGDKVRGLTWMEVKRRSPDNDDYIEDWKEIAAEKIARALGRHLGSQWSKHNDVLAMALEMASPGIIKRLVQWRMDIAEEVVSEEYGYEFMHDKLDI